MNTLAGSGHVAYVCHGEHEDGGWGCQFCAGGLFSCTRCGSAEGATTTHCSGVLMTADQLDAVYAGTLDFQDGEWCEQPSIYTPAGQQRRAAIREGREPAPSGCGDVGNSEDF